MAENQPSSFADSIREARQRLALELRAQAEQIQKLNQELTELQQLHERTEQEASHQWDEVARAAALPPPLRCRRGRRRCRHRRESGRWKTFWAPSAP